MVPQPRALLINFVQRSASLILIMAKPPSFLLPLPDEYSLYCKLYCNTTLCSCCCSASMDDNLAILYKWRPSDLVSTWHKQSCFELFRFFFIRRSVNRISKRIKRLEVHGQIEREREDSAVEYKYCTFELVDWTADDRVILSRHIWVGGYERRWRRRRRDQSSKVGVWRQWDSAIGSQGC